MQGGSIGEKNQEQIRARSSGKTQQKRNFDAVLWIDFDRKQLGLMLFVSEPTSLLARSQTRNGKRKKRITFIFFKKVID